MIYFITELLLIITFLLIEKIKKPQNLLMWIPVSFVGYECYSCLATGILTILHIPANIYSMGLINIFIILCFLKFIYKDKRKQQYYMKLEDVFFILIYCVLIIIVCLNRFGTDIRICFETSDPGTHLKMAMNFVNNKAVDGMYLGQVTNGLFIEGMQEFFNGVVAYKSFIIKYCFNFLIAGWMFFSSASLYVEKKIGKCLVYIVTIIYILGYPYNDMVFGFVYLQLTVTIICYLLFICYLFMNECEKDNNLIIGLMSLGCLGVGIGYTLFAPLVFVALLICAFYKAGKEKWLINRKHNFLSLDFCKLGLQIFLLPTFLTIWFLIIQPIIEKTTINYINALNIEGYIYRNLFSDFGLYVIFAIAGAIIYIKNKKITLDLTVLILGLFYEGFFFIKMIREEVSTYYFYKINYLMWMIILICFIAAIVEMFQREKIYILCYFVGAFILFFLNLTNAENKLQLKNINYDPFTDSYAVGRIYAYNYILTQRETEVSQNLVDMCKEVEKIEKDSDGIVAFVGNWLDRYWYEAMTNQRFDTEYNYLQPMDIVNEFNEKKYGKYILVIKESDEYKENSELFDNMHRLIENDYAFMGYY